MFRVSVAVDVPDLDKHSIEIECPHCSLHVHVRLDEIRRREFTMPRMPRDNAA